MHAEPSFTKCLPGDHDRLTPGRETADGLGNAARMRLRPAFTSVALLAVLTALLVAVANPSPAAAASKPCWKSVINDWLDNGTIDQAYKPVCYQQALKHVPEDLRDYSNITDAISAALANSLRGTKPSGPTTGSGASGNGVGGGSAASAGKNRKLLAAPDRSYYRRAIDNLGTTSADSLPIPLLVLAGLGTALLLSAAGLMAHKRLRARPRPPAPGP
ncbi:MAG: hypothetical protein QOG06_2182 [Gaiellaceae bacterium]|jgi:hypothetical protein|nr:hypothetical protein [Gaiellaceae bacterium]